MQARVGTLPVIQADLLPTQATWQPIGASSTHTIYKTTWRNPIAIKWPKNNIGSERDNEVAILKKLTAHPHENIVRYYGYGRKHKKLGWFSPFFHVMELAKCDLYHFINEYKPTKWKQRFSLMRQMAQGLRHLHKLGILHLDMKSLNILLFDSNVAKIADFDGAQKNSNGSSPRKYTVQWAAPEVLSNTTHGTFSDIYSLIMIYWELASWQHPYEQRYPNESPKRFKHKVTIDACSGQHEKIPDDCPRQLAKLITWGWKREHNFRPKIDQVISSLQKIRAS